jgi:Xaa-Pro aminopeptidase
MNYKFFCRFLVILCAFVFVIQPFVYGQRTGYSKEEITRRRMALMEKVEEGIIVLFGDALPQPGAHFRQDNDFFYFTALEDVNTILVMTPRTKQSYLFIPRQTEREEMIEGANLLKEKNARETTGLTDIYPITYFDEFIARQSTRHGLTFHLRLSPRDTVDNGRWETRIFSGRKNRSHYNDFISADNHRVKKLKERYPMFTFKDITPLIDDLRVIKSAEEIEILRRNGKISAEGVKQAMLATKPGVFEYELEATAIYQVLKKGATGPAYPPIVGSGPNSCIWHYNENSRQVEDGDLVLMDFGGDLDHLCMDITRTWPVSGKFTEEQKKYYKSILAVQKACIEAYRPGVTAADVRKHVEEVLKKKGIDSLGQRGGIGHYVGLCTHDVGPRGIPLREGMVFAIEPGYYLPEKNIGIRIEDTVLITKDGCEVLTKNVPKEIHEIEKLMAGRK